MKSRFLNILMLSCLLLLGACEKEERIDELPEGKPVSATFYINASGTPENPTGNREIINSWWVAFVNAEGNVAEIVTRDISSSPKEKDDFKLVLAPGVYTIVAFANKLPSKIDNITYSITYGDKTLHFKKGEAAPVTYATGGDFLWDETAPENWPSDKLIPMTGLQRVSITGRVTEPFSIEVVRQVAKFEIEFENVGKRGLNIHNYWIEEFKSNKTKLFPTYSSLGAEPDLPEDPIFLDVHRSLNDLRIEAGAKGAPDIFYTLESRVSKQPQKVYTLCVDVTHDYLENFGSTRDTITALLTDLDFVTRNDHIKVPIHLTDYIFRVEAIFYPPIGGYPAQVTDVNNGSYYIRFGSIGDFEIRPHARKAEANSIELAPKQMNLSIITEQLNAGVSIFSVQPYIDETTGEIRGTIGTQKGAARVWVICSIPEVDDEGKAVTLRYVRSILVIRE